MQVVLLFVNPSEIICCVGFLLEVSGSQAGLGSENDIVYGGL